MILIDIGGIVISVARGCIEEASAFFFELKKKKKRNESSRVVRFLKINLQRNEGIKFQLSISIHVPTT